MPRRLGTRARADRFASFGLVFDPDRALLLSGSSAWLDCSIDREIPGRRSPHRLVARAPTHADAEVAPRSSLQAVSAACSPDLACAGVNRTAFRTAAALPPRRGLETCDHALNIGVRTGSG